MKSGGFFLGGTSWRPHGSTIRVSAIRRARFPIVYFEIIGADGGRLRCYYCELFDWQFDVATTPRGFDYASGRDDGVGVEGTVDAAPPGTSGYLTFYVAVAEVEATLACAQRLGGGSSGPTD